MSSKSTILKYCCGILFCAAATLTAGPFSPEWNFDAEPAPSGKVKTIRESGPQGVFRFDYDEYDRLVSRSVYSDNKLASHSRLTYDARNRLVKLEFFRGEAKTPDYVETAQYNSNGLASLVREGKDAKGQPFRHATSSIKLYPDGKVREIVMPKDDTAIIWRWDFDEQGRLTALGALAGNKNLGTGLYRCDARGNISEARRFRENGLPAGYIANRYKYDKQGNWIEKTTDFGHNAGDIVRTTTTTRYIEYRNR